MDHDDFHVEPVRGLPEALPPGEVILWQGAPDPGRLAREAWKVRWVAGYFAAAAIWRVGASTTEAPLGQAIAHAGPIVAAGAIACLILYGIAWVQAKATVYTLTNRRVAMRIGAALTMTLNLPHVCIGSAGLSLRRDGTGTLAFELIGDDRISHMMTWPHVRPWHIMRTQPALRCIPDAARVAEIFAEAAETRITEPQIARVEPVLGVAAE